MPTNPSVTFTGVELNQVAPDQSLAASHRKSQVALTTSTHYGFHLHGCWDRLRARNGFPSRYIARQDGAAVWLYDRWPNEQEETDARVYFGSGAVVQVKGAPDPTDAVEVVFRERQRVQDHGSGNSG